MGFFKNFKVSLGFGINDNDEDRPRKHHHGHREHNHHEHDRHDHHGHIGPRERELVEDGLGVFAWIEKDGIFYEGDIPGVSGIMNVNMADSFEECFNELKENIDNSISADFSSFRQKVSLEEIREEHPNARIVFIKINKD